MKRFFAKLIVIFLAIAFIVCVAWFAASARVNFATSDGKFLSFGLNNISAAPTTLDIKFEPSGTNIKNGKLQIRLDFFPRVESKSYSTYYIEIRKGIWQLNPCLSHFLIVPSDITALSLVTIINTSFTADVTATIDDSVIQANSAHLLSPLMRTKVGLDINESIPKELEKTIIDAVNTRLSGLALIGSGSGEIQEIIPESIDVGPGATDRATNVGTNFPLYDVANPANATGTLDTLETWFSSNATGVDFFTTYTSGSNQVCRDVEAIGNVASGSKQTFTGKSLDVAINDYLGIQWDSSSSIEKVNSGGSGVYRYTTTGTPSPGTYGVATIDADGAISIYATGTEPSNPSVTNSPNSINLGTLAPSTTYYAKGSAPSNPVQDGECTFTITISDATADIFMTMADFTGGVGWNIAASDPGVDEVQITAYYSGQNPASGLVLSNSAQEFKSSQAAGTLKWDFKIVTGSSFTDGVTKVGVLTISVAAP